MTARKHTAVLTISALLAVPAAAQDSSGTAKAEAKPKHQSSVPVIVKGSEHEQAEGALCRQVLTALGAEFKAIKPIKGEGQCRVTNAVQVAALPHGVKLRPAATLNCSMAVMLAAFAHKELKPLAEDKLGKVPVSIRVGTHYKCRSRNNRPGARISEHAFGNAIDIIGFNFAGRDPVVIEGDYAAGAPERVFLAELGRRSCHYFTTVLGPQSDEAHKDHWHFDIRARKRDWRLCFTYPEVPKKPEPKASN